MFDTCGRIVTAAVVDNDGTRMNKQMLKLHNKR